MYREKDKLKDEYLTRMASVYFIWNPDKHRRVHASGGATN